MRRALHFFFTVLLLFAAAAAGDSIGPVNGGFDQTDEHGRPKGWATSGRGIEMVRDDGRTFLRIRNERATDAPFVEQRIDLKPDWAQVTLKVAMRTHELTPGGESWENARIQLQFLNAEGERVGDWPAIPAIAKANQPWRELKVELQVPKDATQLSIQPMLLHCVGVCDFDDLVVTTAPVGALPEGLSFQWGDEPIERLTDRRGRIVLNGFWRFSPARAEAETKAPDRNWGAIRVPGSWKPTSMPGLVSRGRGGAWDEFKPDALAKAWYRRQVTIPADWNGRAIWLELDRVSTDAKVYVNGQACGEVHWPSGSVRLDPAATPGRQVTVDVLVVAANDAERVEVYMGPNQVYTTDAQLQSRGLIGDVMLSSIPAGAHVGQIRITPSTRRDDVTIDLQLVDVKQAGRADVTVRMLDGNGREAKRFASSIALRAADRQSAELRFDWPDAERWDLGQPSLYTAVVEIKASSIIDDAIAQRFGFREFWIDGRQFMLNGTPVRFRPINMPGEMWSKMAGSEAATRTLLQSYLDAGFNLVEQWPDDMDARGVMHFRELVCRVADEVGIAVAASLPSMKSHLARGPNHWSNPDVQERFRQRITRNVDRLYHHPSALMYSFTGNAFGHSEDQNPRLIGMTRQSPQWRRPFFEKTWHERMAMGDQAVAMIKRIDPTRPVMVHQGGPVGDVYALNNYLNWMPLQEREQWLSHWAERGQMPYMAVEFGTPLHCSFMRGKAGGGWGRWTGASHSEPLMSEYCAAYLGPEAYALETDAYRDLIRSHYAPAESEQRGHPKMLYHTFWGSNTLNFAPANQRVQELFVANTWRSWRLSGITGGMVPWDDAHGFNHTTGAGQAMIDLPQFKPGQRGTAIDQVLARFQYPYSDRGSEVQLAGRTLLEVNGPTLAFIAGSTEKPLSKDHHSRSGELVAKQIALINDTRTDQPYQWTLVVTLGGREITRQTGNGTVRTGSEELEDVSIAMPIVSETTDGALKLTASIGDRQHTDAFGLRVYPTAAATTMAVAVIDPVGDTTRMLKAIGARVSEELPRVTSTPVFVGRRALESDPTAMAKLEAFVASGGCVVVMAQRPDWMERYWGLRAMPMPARRVFVIDAKHPIARDLDAEDLRDWNGTSTLVDPKPDYLNDEAERGTYVGFPIHGWRWGGEGAVTSAAVEKPHRAGWTPILECGFDLAYSPLLELHHGRGRVLLCMLDLEDHYEADPVARQLVDRLVRYASQPSAEARTTTSFIGNADDSAWLKRVGVEFQRVTEVPDSPQLLIVGPDAQISDGDLTRFAQSGGRLFFMPRERPHAPLGASLTMAGNFSGARTVPDWPEARGLSLSDLRWRVDGDAWLMRKAAAVGAEGLLARKQVGNGVIIYGQIDPDRFDVDAEPYLRYTRWRQTRAVAQLLANLGATFEMDRGVFHPSDSRGLDFDLAGAWRVKMTHRLDPAPDYLENAHVDHGISDQARAAVKAGFDDSNWSQVRVPGDWDNWGEPWQGSDGEAVFRRTITLPADAAGRDMELSLGPIDDFDQTYVNGELVGQTGKETPNFYAHPRRYIVPARLIKPGQNVIAIRVFDRFGGGGLVAQPAQMTLKPRRDNEAGYYHPDYRTDFEYGDDPYRYCRW